MKSHKNILEKYFSKADLDLIAKEIAKQEEITSGEIRVSIHAKRTWLERNRSIHEMAVREFHRLKMHMTKERSGVLLYFIFEARQFYILADEGIHLKAKEVWESVAASVTKDFKEAKYCEGICEAVRTVGKALQEHYPYKSGKSNELSDEVELS